jgi:hypothetical protein
MGDVGGVSGAFILHLMPFSSKPVAKVCSLVKRRLRVFGRFGGFASPTGFRTYRNPVLQLKPLILKPPHSSDPFVFFPFECLQKNQDGVCRDDDSDAEDDSFWNLNRAPQYSNSG